LHFVAEICSLCNRPTGQYWVLTLFLIIIYTSTKTPIFSLLFLLLG